jgi:hypothetical protein
MWNLVQRLRVPIAFALGFIFGAIFTLLAITAGWFMPDYPPGETKEWGEFPTTPRIELLDDGRQLRLLEDFVYIDPRGRAWTANQNSVVDGASIPRVFWTIAGGPLEGQYRNASIVHDEGCVRMTEPREDVHLMFYEACRCGGLPEYKSKVLYAAVYHFGKRWDIKPVSEQRMEIGPDGKERVVTVTKTVPVLVRSTQDPATDVRERLEKYIGSQNPSLAELRALDPNAP